MVRCGCVGGIGADERRVEPHLRLVTFVFFLLVSLAFLRGFTAALRY